tara:strand:+ start:1195 stop:1395 length:201 start_codon:yes stop_codon:yes gene_type:complete
MITPNRIDEIKQASNDWPYWGNVQRFMTKEEIEETKTVWKTMNGNNSFMDALNKIGLCAIMDALND